MMRSQASFLNRFLPNDTTGDR